MTMYMYNPIIYHDFAPGIIMTMWTISMMEMIGVFDGYLHTVIGNLLIVGGGLYYINNGMSFETTPSAATDRKKETIQKFMGMMTAELGKVLKEHQSRVHDFDDPPPPPPSTPDELPYDNDDIRKNFEFIQKAVEETDKITKTMLDWGMGESGGRIDDEGDGFPSERLWPDRSAPLTDSVPTTHLTLETEKLWPSRADVEDAVDDATGEDETTLAGETGFPPERLNWPDTYGKGEHTRGRSPTRREYEPVDSRNRSRSRSRDREGDSDCEHELYRAVIGYDDKYTRCKKCKYETVA